MYEFFQSQLHNFLGIAALILSLGIVGTAALRVAINAYSGATFFPPEYVVVYGGVFTLFLLVAYVPVRITFWNVGKSLVEHIMGTAPSSQPALTAWLDQRSKLEGSLNLSLTSASALFGPVATLLPLFAGWISVLLGSKG